MASYISNRLTLENPKNSGLKKGDEVIVVAGAHKGSKGKIEGFNGKTNRVFVAGVNMAKKHTKANGADQVGGILDKQMPIHISNVMFWDAKADKPSKIGIKVEGDKHSRISKKSGTILD